ncbi:MAG: winged helix DNA-binding domain-containing protein [Chloroflexota bacterium]|nr:winged helix DNA-binding domain-containing protein [Chloroflexota bacterium]
MTNLAVRRLHSQRLSGEQSASAVDVVRRLTCVQSQDYIGARWAIGQRPRASPEASIDQLFDQGAVLRTHVLRPTWHFVLPDDIRWLLELTGPRVRDSLASRYRQLGIDGGLVTRANAAFRAALSGGRNLTRPQLGAVLQAAGIPTEGQRLPHLLMGAELDGLITSGPRHGKQHTYALLEERAPNARSLDREEALAELARRYFQSHGPAQLQDFGWWSGLTTTDARTGIAAAGAALAHEMVDGKNYWFDAEARPASDVSSMAHLLPNFDEYTVGYRDRTAAIDPDRPFDPALFSFGSILSNIVTVGGRVRGAWRRTVVGSGMRIDVRLLDRLGPDEAIAVTRAGDRMSRFLTRPVELTGLQS